MTSLASSLTALPAAAARARACLTTSWNVVRSPVVRGRMTSCTCGTSEWGRCRATIRWHGGPAREDRLELVRDDIEGGDGWAVQAQRGVGASREATADCVESRRRRLGFYNCEQEHKEDEWQTCLVSPWQWTPRPRARRWRGGACEGGGSLRGHRPERLA